MAVERGMCSCFCAIHAAVQKPLGLQVFEVKLLHRKYPQISVDPPISVDLECRDWWVGNVLPVFLRWKDRPMIHWQWRLVVYPPRKHLQQGTLLLRFQNNKATNRTNNYCN